MTESERLAEIRRAKKAERRKRRSSEERQPSGFAPPKPDWDPQDRFDNATRCVECGQPIEAGGNFNVCDPCQYIGHAEIEPDDFNPLKRNNHPE